jgi:DnaJ-class molecular chaperone
VRCSECGGGGQLVLLTSSRPCCRCGGTGWIDATLDKVIDGAGSRIHVIYDEQGRVVFEMWTGTQTTTLLEYPDA